MQHLYISIKHYNRSYLLWAWCEDDGSTVKTYGATQQRANTVGQSGNTQCWLESEKCGAGAKCASPSDRPPKNFSTSQRGKSQAASRANVCAACQQIPSVLRQQIQKAVSEQIRLHGTYLLRREVPRKREGGFLLPLSSASSSPLSQAHFLGFLVSR